ncbi:MAG: hypothetical protein NC080_08735 [Paraprevotella sp.]|nr:hypothetical protein [Paraprevotella sp.]
MNKALSKRLFRYSDSSGFIVHHHIRLVVLTGIGVGLSRAAGIVRVHTDWRAAVLLPAAQHRRIVGKGTKKNRIKDFEVKNKHDVCQRMVADGIVSLS